MNIAAIQIHKSEIVGAKVPKEIVDGFLRAHQLLRVLNGTIQNPGRIMEESAYRNYESSLPRIQELFPKSGILEEDKQRMLDFIATRDEAKIAYNVFVEHPGIREILQQENLSKIAKMWVQVLPIPKENILEGISNMGEIYLANKALVQEGIKESLLAHLREVMDLAVQTGNNTNNLVKWTILDVPRRVGIT